MQKQKPRPATIGEKIGKLDRKKKTALLLAAAAILVLTALIVILCTVGGVARCQAAGCSEEAEYGDYCISHVCLHGSCTNRRYGGTRYCILHQETAAVSSANAASDLEFYNVSISHNSSYTVVTGKVKNTGSRTYKFVEIKGAFKTYSGQVVDTDWTYAVGSEGLAPGESTSFRMSCDKNTSIRDCEITIIDYD